MSHIVTIECKTTDPTAIRAACQRMGLVEPVQGTASLFSGELSGLLLQLPGWHYPVVLDVDSGSIRYDNYGGAWGDMAYLHKFLQSYAVEKAKLEARHNNFPVHETTLSDGSIRLQIMEGY